MSFHVVAVSLMTYPKYLYYMDAKKTTTIFKDYPDLKKCGVTSRFYPNGYENVDEEIAANLYLWLHQSYHVLWHTDTITNEIYIYSKTVLKLASRFATLLKQEKTESIHNWFQIIQIFGLIELQVKQSPETRSFPKNQLDKMILAKAQELLQKEASHIHLVRFVKMFG
jgi:hypothetical protein